jgi:hypothetical protein
MKSGINRDMMPPSNQEAALFFSFAKRQIHVAVQRNSLLFFFSALCRKNQAAGANNTKSLRE